MYECNLISFRSVRFHTIMATSKCKYGKIKIFKILYPRPTHFCYFLNHNNIILAEVCMINLLFRAKKCYISFERDNRSGVI